MFAFACFTSRVEHRRILLCVRHSGAVSWAPGDSVPFFVFRMASAAEAPVSMCAGEMWDFDDHAASESFGSCSVSPAAAADLLVSGGGGSSGAQTQSAEASAAGLSRQSRLNEARAGWDFDDGHESDAPPFLVGNDDGASDSESSSDTDSDDNEPLDPWAAGWGESDSDSDEVEPPLQQQQQRLRSRS